MSDISKIYSFINQKILKGNSFQDIFDDNRDGVILKVEYTDVMYSFFLFLYMYYGSFFKNFKIFSCFVTNIYIILLVLNLLYSRRLCCD